MATMVSTAAGSLPTVIDGPSFGQVITLCIGLAWFAAAAATAIWSLGRQSERIRRWAPAWLGYGLMCNAVLLIWRGEQQDWIWPIRHKFDTLVLLASLVAVVGLYVAVWWRWELSTAAFAPLAALMQAAGLTETADLVIESGPQPTGTAFVVHVLAFVLAAVCFAAACVAGVAYLALHRRLRRAESAMNMGRWPSLESLESLNSRAVTLGFPLLTIGLWLGMVQVWHEPDVFAWLSDAKVVSAFVIWLIYAAMLHLQHLPRFRGTRSALMSVLSFGGLLLTLLISDFVVTRHP